MLREVLVVASTHKCPFGACWLWCGVCDSIRPIDKRRLQFIELYNEKEAKPFKWIANSDRKPGRRGQDVVVGNRLLQRPGDEQLKLGGRLSLQHLVAFPNPKTTSGIMNHKKRGFSTAVHLFLTQSQPERIKPMFTDYEAKITELENKVVLFESRFNNMKIERVEKRIFT